MDFSTVTIAALKLKVGHFLTKTDSKQSENLLQWDSISIPAIKLKPIFKGHSDKDN